MSSLQTPLHRVKGLGAAHSGTGHFWRQRVSAALLMLLSAWLLFVIVGLAGTTEVTALQFLAHPWNTILMGAFVVTALYHAVLGLQVVFDDYVHNVGLRIFSLFAVRLAALAIGAISLFALIRIASL